MVRIEVDRSASSMTRAAGIVRGKELRHGCIEAARGGEGVGEGTADCSGIADKQEGEANCPGV